tara:strand:- start:413 stop:847 length:435 start_codon:yes stop_codon:yes gene_type:complete
LATLRESFSDDLALIINVNNEINMYQQVINSIDTGNWLNFTKLEIDELELQNIWNLVELPFNRIYLRGKWVYKIKPDINNNITKYKSRWVVKGFDYLETFSATCRPESYRLIFILVMFYKWKLLQYDVKNAFLYAKIDVDIYVE